MKKLLLLLTLLLWLPLAQANEAEYQRGYEAYKSGDYKTAYAILKPLAEQGHAEAQSYLGDMHNWGQGVKDDDAEAIKWYSKAAKQGHAEAQHWLGRVYKNRRGVPQNNIYAYMWLSIADTNGVGAGIFIKSLTKNMSSEDIAKAQALATKCLDTNYQACPGSIKWSRKAAEQGDVYAQWRLGEVYENGDGVPKNYAEAFKWYSKVAKQGNADAQYKIAEWYRDGKGIPKNNIYAYMWFSIAETNGWRVGNSIKELTEYMFSDELTKAQALTTRCWESKYEDCSETARANVVAAQGDKGDKVQGVPRGYLYSYMWLSLSLDSLSKQMSSAELAEAQALFQRCLESAYRDCSE